MKLKTKLNISRTYNFKTDGWSYYLGSDGGRRRLPTPFINIGDPLKNLVGPNLEHPKTSCAPNVLNMVCKKLQNQLFRRGVARFVGSLALASVYIYRV